MKVKTLKKHSNHFGKKYNKKPGDEYEHPQPAGDIKFGYVEKVKAKKKAASTPAPTSAPANGV